MHVTTSSQIIIRQHHFHGNNYFENFSVLFVFYYSPIFLFKINNSFHFITCVIIVVIVIVCETIITSSTSKSSSTIVVYQTSAYKKNFNRIKTVDCNSSLNNDNDKNQINLSPITTFLNSLSRCSPVLRNPRLTTTQNQQIKESNRHDDQHESANHSNNRRNYNSITSNTSKINIQKFVFKCLKTEIKLCNSSKELKSNNDDCCIEQSLKEKFTALQNQCEVKIQQALKTESCVPKVSYYVDGSNNKSIQIYHTGLFSRHVSTECNTIIRNILKLEKHETREYLLSKGNERSLPKDRQSFIDMSKVERNPFSTGTTGILTLRSSAFLLTIKKSCNLMKTLIRSLATQAQCARHPHRHKKVGQ